MARVPLVDPRGGTEDASLSRTRSHKNVGSSSSVRFNDRREVSNMGAIDWEELQDKAWNAGMEYAPKVGAALAILILGWIVAKFVRRMLRRLMRKARMEETLAGFLANILYGMLLVFVVIAALSRLGIETNSFVAILGAAGLAVGFALQGSLSNFAAGVMLILNRPFKTGDHVEIAGVEGDIAEISIFSTMIDTKDNKRVIIPNAEITAATITNFSAHDKRRVDMVMGIGYEADIKQAKEILTDICTSHPKSLDSPAPTVAVMELADSSVNFMVRPWCHPDHYWDVYCDVTEQVKLAFDSAGISIPYPQQEVHMRQIA